MSIFIADGYRVVEQLIDLQAINNLTQAIGDCFQTNSSYGVRNLHHKIPLVNNLANSQMLINHLSKYTNYRQFKLIKAIYFNKITTVRIALDDSNANNGGLKIIPRSHNLGVLNQAEIDRLTQQQTPLSFSLKAGDALMMHPLILHSSNRNISDLSRRIIHLEYSSGDLPLLTYY